MRELLYEPSGYLGDLHMICKQPCCFCILKVDQTCLPNRNVYIHVYIYICTHVGFLGKSLIRVNSPGGRRSG